ncbi:bifunctional RNase H/acid phosphatase [Actinomadura sp. HBU206391]|uniref:bifunctional RNase H/acid phosphatase n=1 Tax=Actinomadura sp. HBU206391 TaxID=2731692 RepID=UPI00164EECB4|nr:bifunctional RNase H/acid phosphatase [Actinomadura sp. HBU206391]MBC6462151.1 bifunctional RNase H/acid phosphatase [Actinomadura sp. HBU206391]
MTRRLIVEADGGSRGNPGPAGYGAVVRDAPTGEVLAEVAEAIGRATNNVAEYRGLIAGLGAAAELSEAPERTAVEARMDSKLVVEQMSGRWKIKHPDMIPLAREARRLASGLGSVKYSWVPRAQNSHADRLANEAMDAAAKGGTWRRRTSEVDEPDQDPEPVVQPGPAVAKQGWAAPTSAPTTTLLLRHGETPLSAERRFAGTGDFPLTDTGVAQAKAAALAFAERGVDAIVTSPLSRCRDTAVEIAAAAGLEVRVEEGFRETDFGDWEGHTFAEVRERWPAEMDAWLADPSVAPPGGESFTDTLRRVIIARDKLMVRYRRETVLVVSHVTPIKLLLRDALLAPMGALYRMHLDVASLSAIDWYDDGPAVVRALNDTRHLS